MTVFISHSFADQAEFGNVADWLDRDGVPYWRPEDVKAGSSLRGQLRQAVASCNVCIFVATHNSVKSSWCGAELGAFWGAETPIIVYLADSSLTDDQLPPILHGDAWDRKLSRIAERAAELTNIQARPASIRPALPTDNITAMTVEQLESLIAGAVSLVRANEAVRAASGRGAENVGDAALDAAGQMLRAASATFGITDKPEDDWRRHILWVDDRPGNQLYERHIFESLGITFSLALSTAEALERLSRFKFAAVISDMGRVEGPREGYALLEAIRTTDQETPFIIYALDAGLPEHQREAVQRGAQGSTDQVAELVDMVVTELRRNDTF